MKKITWILFMVPLIFLWGCGKERTHRPLTKIEVMSKSLIDTEKEYLYVPSTGQISRSTSLSRPYFQGQELIVKLDFEEHHLVARAVNIESQFNDNQTNSKVVFKIPISHIDYRERTDAFGEGTNVEEENTFIDWDKRKFFKPKPEQFEFTSIALLPTDFDKLFGSPCSTENGQTDLEFNLNKTGLDIVIRRDFTSSIFCENSFDEFIDLSWSEETHYSLVPLDSVSSKSYTAQKYPREWERTFGFFETLERRLDSSNNSTQTAEEYFIHRWDPDREFITYHLDPRFNKPENKGIKDATLIGVERINAALEEAGAKIRVNTIEGDKDFKPGDIRTSSIVLVEDPVAAGLLGYGPSIVNPRTGEIVQARTVMYPGIMKKLVRRAYDEVIEIHQEQLLAEAEAAEAAAEAAAEETPGETTPPEDPPATPETTTTSVASKIDKVKLELAIAMQDKSSRIHKHNWSHTPGELKGSSTQGSQSGSNDSIFNTGDHLAVIGDKTNLKEKSFFERTKLSVQGLFHQYQERNAETKAYNLDQIDIIEAYSRHNMMPAREETFFDIADGLLKEELLALGEQKDWDSLTAEIRQEIIDLVMPYVWIPTLIHEIGHNLGLRHNFAGSEDSENFYTIEELAERGVTSELGSPYSSMMEYSKSEITGLRVPGKYDIAALRYGYADSIELQSGEIIPASKALPASLKSFEFCTDEGVSLNPTCNRFDEGTNITEIVDSLIDNYEERYKRGYFRRNRASFSRYDDYMAAARINSQFRSLRLVYERLSDIMINFDVSLEEIKDIDWLNEYNVAANKVSDFFMGVIAEPDYSCVVFENGAFDSIIPFKDISGNDAKNCFDVSLNTGFEVIGDLGKSMESFRYSDNPNIYLDQIDVRGVWFHKILAMKYLTARKMGSFSFDLNTVSLLDHPEAGPKINSFIKDMVMGNVTAKTQIRLEDNSSFDFDYDHSLAEGYIIRRPLFYALSWYLGTPRDNIDIMESLVHEARKNINNGLKTPEAQVTHRSLSAYTSIPLEGLPDDAYQTIVMGGQRFVASEDNDLALQIMDTVGLVKNYDQFTREELIEIFTNFDTIEADPVALAALSDEEKEIMSNGSDNLFNYLVGDMPSQDYFFRTLTAMTR